MVTIRDVARVAKVSIATVSRALNNTGTVRPEIRERVLRAARKLRYTPHGGARSLIVGRTHTVGLLLPDLYGEYFSELIRGVDREARRRGLHLLVSGSHGSSSEAASAVRSLNGRIDGLIAMLPGEDVGFLQEAVPQTLPTVLLNTRTSGAQYPTFLVDDFGGARAMTRHLLGRGYRRLAHVRGAEGNFQAEERVRGFRAALKGSGAAAAAVLEGDFTEEGGYRAGQMLAAQAERPDAVFAANDMMAVGCLVALREARIRVPDDMALAGFDDIPLARFVTPPLTTVRADIAALGLRALERLAGLIESGPADGQQSVERLPVEIVVRASCGGAPGEHHRAAGLPR
ncbi:MAG: LacI family DNA-binding transcriptional regulator [Steroidobacteraceae bacterium]|jgi:LacI family transcriptional regulator